VVCVGVDMSSDAKRPRIPAEVAGPAAAAAAAAIGEKTGVVCVVRGPAGSGKSTVTGLVVSALRASGEKVAYLEQDHFRNVIAGGGGGAREIGSAMMEASMRAALAHGYVVILEGILNAKHHGGLFEAARGLANAVFFYLDVDIEETKRRHAGRAKAAEFGAEKLEEWFASAAPTGFSEEQMVPASSAKDATVALVVKAIAAAKGKGLSSAS
jgi:hypothetical protein